MSAPRIGQQHYAAKMSLRRPKSRKIPCALAALTRDIPYVMTRREQATYDRARERWGVGPAQAFARVCREAYKERIGIPSPSLALVVECGESASRTVATMTHAEYAELHRRWDAENPGVLDRMPTATIDGVVYEIPYVQDTAHTVVVEVASGSSE